MVKSLATPPVSWRLWRGSEGYLVRRSDWAVFRCQGGRRGEGVSASEFSSRFLFSLYCSYGLVFLYFSGGFFFCISEISYNVKVGNDYRVSPVVVPRGLAQLCCSLFG